MSDATYSPRVYKKQGGNEMVVANGGTLTVEAGGVLSMSGILTGLIQGSIFFVNSVGGSDSANGLTWATAFATLDHAVGACTADHGDAIFVAAKHAETLVGAGGVAADVAGITIIGMGTGRQRPIFTSGTDTAASFDITAARITVANLVFVNGIDAQTAMINVSGADVSISGCEVQTGDASTQTLIGILTTAGAVRLRVEQCHFHGLVTAGTTSQIALVGGDAIVIKNNILVGACAATGNISAGTTASLNGVIDGNIIQNQTADANNKAIVLGAGDTFSITNNRMAVIDSTAPAPVTAAAAFVGGNYWTGAVGLTAATLM
jgi:hypothetical protein